MTTTVPAERRMANDIAWQFHHVPADRAAEAVAGHVGRFWNPRMRTRLVELVDAGADGPDPVVAAAVGLIRADATRGGAR
jgi:formate dehydrogenase subunit delta